MNEIPNLESDIQRNKQSIDNQSINDSTKELLNSQDIIEGESQRNCGKRNIIFLCSR